MPKTPKNEATFEEAMVELEKTVRDLEDGSLSLDESISAFERGIGLIKICNRKLEAAERKVCALTENEDGSVGEVPFDEKNER